MDRAYEDDKTRALAAEQGFIPVVPPKKNRKNLGTTIKNSTNVVMNLNAISLALSVLEKSSLVMINLMLFFSPPSCLL